MIEIPVELSEILVWGVTALVTWLVVEGFKGLGEAFGKDFSNFAKVVAAILSASAVSAVTGVLSALLALVPVEYAPITQQVLGLLVLLFSAFGIQRQARMSRG